MVLLYPSTKIYELYVYTHTVGCFVEHLYSEPRHLGKLSIRIDTAKLHFNRYLKKLSRIIAYTTKDKTPRPDISVRTSDKIAIIDAKYRRLDSGRPRLLDLGDAEKMAVCIPDTCGDTGLQAIVAVPQQTAFSNYLRE